MSCGKLGRHRKRNSKELLKALRMRGCEGVLTKVRKRGLKVRIERARVFRARALNCARICDRTN